ncbi:hypothetical protein ACOSQ4_004578 [Xanthoceras sorbifolium]
MERVKIAKKRCKGVIERIGRLPPSTNITDSCKQSLLKLAFSELNFLSRCFSSSNPIQLPLSTNIGHLEAVLHILQQSFVTGISRVANPFELVSNLFIHKSKGLRLRIEQVLEAARSSLTLKPFSVVLFFPNGLNNFVCDRLRHEFGATEFSLFEFHFCEEIEDGWMNVLPRSFGEACVLEIKLDCCGNGVLSVKDSVLDAVKHSDKPQLKPTNQVSSARNQVESAEPDSLLTADDLINFDTTALIALVSGISNGCADKLLASPELKLRQRFKGNVQFVIAQAMSEIQNPILEEFSGVIAGKRGIIAQHTSIRCYQS